VNLFPLYSKKINIPTRERSAEIPIFPLQIKIISRGKGKSAVVTAAYRAGKTIKNKYAGITHDYTCNRKEYTDKGFSGKNTDHPRFQELVRDIERGLIRRVVVYKLDRISCSIIDFANMMELFQRYQVEFISSTE